MLSHRHTERTDYSGFDVIDSQSADGVTMYSNQPGVCTHLTFILPIAYGSSSSFFSRTLVAAGSCDAIKREGWLKFTRFPHTTITHPADRTGHPRSMAKNLYEKKSDALVTHCNPSPLPHTNRASSNSKSVKFGEKMIRRQTRKWELRVLFFGWSYYNRFVIHGSAGLLLSRVRHDVSRFLPPNIRQNDRSVMDGIYFLPGSIIQLGAWASSVMPGVGRTTFSYSLY